MFDSRTSESDSEEVRGGILGKAGAGLVTFRTCLVVCVLLLSITVEVVVVTFPVYVTFSFLKL